ncbi:hypothetical protein AZE42_09308 [Rhizopogon vesiculosus]|uniref:Integral membrane protein n=1 Tax=Rhizopogon vesiculosus TaxID=180088 RepID=A0A1J8QCD5_9AGAM|nr:hypothetical protein AZE42_09308 [Rhizopogon vesiculosus]
MIGVVSHSIAILSTIFRLVYQTWTRRFWWEDAWAALALFSDVVCLACIWIDVSISGESSFAFQDRYMFISVQARILVVTFTSVLWAARMSIIFSIIRITRHSVSKVQRQATYLIAVSFACMWAMGQFVALSQLITDVIADASLVVVPLHLWKNVGLTRGRKFLVLSIFSSSLLITVVTIPHSITIFRTHSAAKIIFAHIKAALSLFICNLLVIVTFAYRVCSEEVDQSFVSRGLFTSIVMVPYSSGTIQVSAEDGVDWGYEAAEDIRRERTL